MAISPEQRAILIERLKKAQEAKRVKAEARKAAAAAVVEAAPPPKPKADPKPKAQKVEKDDKDDKRENIEKEKEIEKEEPPKVTPIVQEIYTKEQKGTYVGIPDAENEIIVKPTPPPKSKPIDIPKATKEKGYMKLKFYKEPSPKVLKRLMSIHDESTSEEDEEEPAPPAPPPPSQADAKKAHMKQLADYYFNYY